MDFDAVEDLCTNSAWKMLEIDDGLRRKNDLMMQSSQMIARIVFWSTPRKPRRVDLLEIQRGVGPPQLRRDERGCRALEHRLHVRPAEDDERREAEERAVRDAEASYSLRVLKVGTI